MQFYMLIVLLSFQYANITTLGCTTGGSNSCLNGGTCIPSGICNCPFGFTGSTCSLCTLNI